MSKQLTIQIVGWNSARALPAGLEVLQKISPDEVDIFYIDNASHDNSVALVRQLLPAARIWQLEKNYGFGGGHNIGLTACTTPVVLLHNPDVVINYQGILTLLAAFDDQQVAAVQGKLLRPDRVGSNPVIDSVGITLSSALNGVERGAAEVDQGQYQESAELTAVTGACTLYRLSTIRQVAYNSHEIFDQDFFAYKEDVDLGWRLKRAGFSVRYLPIEMGTHVRALGRRGVLNWGLNPSTIWRRLASRRTRYSFRNWVWLIVKNASVDQLLRSFIPIGLRAITLLGLSFLYPPLLTAWIEVILGLPTMLQKRWSGGSRLVSSSASR